MGTDPWEQSVFSGFVANEKASERHLEDSSGENAPYPLPHLPVVVWLEGPVLVQAQVLGLLVAQLREVRVERGEVQAGHVLVWRGGEKRDVGGACQHSARFMNNSRQKENKTSQRSNGSSHVLLLLPKCRLANLCLASPADSSRCRHPGDHCGAADAVTYIRSHCTFLYMCSAPVQLADARREGGLVMLLRASH